MEKKKKKKKKHLFFHLQKMFIIIGCIQQHGAQMFKFIIKFASCLMTNKAHWWGQFPKYGARIV
jgi:hypothetical protein